MRETPDIETSSDAYAQRFSGNVGKYMLSVQQEKVEQALAGPFGGSVLDVGGGHGQLVKGLLTRGCEITVAASSNNCYQKVRQIKGAEDVKLVTTDILNLPFADNCFDLVISVRLVSHVSDWPRLLSEFCRVAKSTVVIDYPASTGFNALTPLLFKAKQGIEKNTRRYRNFSQKELTMIFNQHGFCVSGLYHQFALPMVIHRAMKDARWPRVIESICAHAGITGMIGSPVILRADRCANAHNK